MHQCQLITKNVKFHLLTFSSIFRRNYSENDKIKSELADESKRQRVGERSVDMPTKLIAEITILMKNELLFKRSERQMNVNHIVIIVSADRGGRIKREIISGGLTER